MNIMVKSTQFKFLEPDPLWEAFGINSQQEYVDKYVIKGKFHSHVPEAVRNDFRIVERLLFYSYYHYPILDEVYSKLTRIFESSVNLRMQELNIKVKKNDGLFRKLELLEPHLSENLSKSFDGVRKLRNSLAHPNTVGLMGITIFNGIYTLCNLLNQLFLDKESIDKYDSKVESYASQSKHLQKGLYILEYQHSKLLIESALPVAIGGNSDTLSSLWVFHPVLSRFSKTKDDYKLTYPIILSLKEVKIEKSGISAKELHSNDLVELVITEKKENIRKQENFKKQVYASTPDVVKMHMSFVEGKVMDEIEKFMQSERWE